MGGSVRALVRQAGRIARRAIARDGASQSRPILRCQNRPDGRFFALGKSHQLMSKREGENPCLVQAEQLAGMNGRRPPRRGEPRSGESSRPYSQLKQKGRRETGPFVLVADNLILPVMGVARRRSGDAAGLVWGSSLKVEINSATRNMLHLHQSFMLHVQGLMGKCIDCATCCVMV